jgi:hypothetical protein
MDAEPESRILPLSVQDQNGQTFDLILDARNNAQGDQCFNLIFPSRANIFLSPRSLCGLCGESKRHA